jgi:hypothetical protein
MIWSDKISQWLQGITQTYPDDIKNRFFYETSVCDLNLTNSYQENYIENDQLNSMSYDLKPFKSYFQSSTNKYVVSFYNLNQSTILIVPMPIKKLYFTTMKEFVDYATCKHQQQFWIFVAEQIINALGTFNDQLYISTHGLGVGYFHLRLDKKPKYYLTNEFK